VQANWQSGKRGVVSMECIIIEQERGAFNGVVFLVCSSFFSGVLG